jgi:hypothetical protein
MDENLYAHDFNRKRILVLSKDGKFIKEIKYDGRSVNFYTTPLVDHDSNVYFPEMTVDKLDFINQSGKRMATIPFKNSLPDFKIKPLIAGRMFFVIFNKTSDSKLFLFFPQISSFIVMNESRFLFKYSIYPKYAMGSFNVKRAEDEKQGKKSSSESMFFSFILDDDDNHCFYLQPELKINGKINNLYQFDLKGELKKVFYIDPQETSKLNVFHVKKNGFFYAIEKGKVKIYREEK